MGFFDRIKDDVSKEMGKGLFYYDVRPDWGSQQPNYRVEIRKALLQYVKENFPQEVEDSIWDLESPPVFKNIKVSISHCEGLGGFVVCSRSVGFDMEVITRLTPPIIERVSLPEELKTAPVKELLWPSKEAVFKCDSQYVMITQINVQFDQTSQNDIYKFRTLNAQGWAFTDHQHVFALAIKN